MGERDLERVMRDFTQQRFNMLLCTTIIETGIDIPTANTIVIHRADKFGLAQLHQLRGRVGRSHHQAYAYLLVPDPEALSKQAQLRLDAIQQMEELGSGFYLAMHDLEIRGAGQVLGEDQSGNMHEIGFQLYTEMLNEAVRALKQGREPDLSQPLAAVTEINLHAPALLPDTYCGDVHERLSIYKRLATCRTLEELIEIQEELIDRFGKLPEPAQALIETHRLRIVAEPLGITKIDAHAESVLFQFRPNPPVDAAASSRSCRRTARSSCRARTSCARASTRRNCRGASRRSARRSRRWRHEPRAVGADRRQPAQRSRGARRAPQRRPTSRQGIPLRRRRTIRRARCARDRGIVRRVARRPRLRRRRKALSDFKLLAMDMDSTLITIECIDEIADYAGKKKEVAADHRSGDAGRDPGFRGEFEEAEWRCWRDFR